MKEQLKKKYGNEQQISVVNHNLSEHIACINVLKVNIVFCNFIFQTPNVIAKI